jgi:hypothetical protein
VKRAEHSGWLLETAESHVPAVTHKPYRAWVSDPQRFVVGYACSATEADAVRAALYDAGRHYRKDRGALAGLELEYFGPGGILPPPAAQHGRCP